jgi:hypothetical protein
VTFQRAIGRAFLILAAIGAATTAGGALYFLGIASPEAWATSAAALAVIATTMAAWTARRVVEIEEDRRLPQVVPVMDFKSRYSLALFRLKNIGGGTAHDVSMAWSVPLKNHKSEPVGPMNGNISYLLPGEDRAWSINTTYKVIREALDGPNIAGTIFYQDSGGRQFCREFSLDISAHEREVLSDHENQIAMYRVQQIADDIRDIRRNFQTFVSDLRFRRQVEHFDDDGQPDK